jgi:hypothetical protein
MDLRVARVDARRGRRPVYRQRAVIGVLGPTRVGESRAERVERQATAIGAGLALAGYGAAVLDGGFTSGACARGVRQHDGLLLDVGRDGADATQQAAPANHGALLAAMHRLLEASDAIMVLSGDVRSLALLTLVWSWGAEATAPYRQVILVGEGWPEIVRTLADAAGLDARTRAMVTFAPEVPEAIEALRYYVAPTP